MFLRKGIPGFIVRLLVFFGLLAWFPGPQLLRGAYLTFCRYGAGVLFDTRIPAGASFQTLSKRFAVRFQPDTTRDKTKDIDALLVIPRRGFIRPNFDVWSGGYLPFAEVIALVLATPIPWRRRWKALVWGAIGANAFLVWRIFLVLVVAVTIPQLGVFPDLAPVWRKTIQVVHDVTMALQTSWVVPILIWIIVTIRRRDLLAAWNHFSGQANDAPASPHKAKAGTSSTSGAPSSLTAQDASATAPPSSAPPTSKKNKGG